MVVYILREMKKLVQVNSFLFEFKEYYMWGSKDGNVLIYKYNFLKRKFCIYVYKMYFKYMCRFF